MCPWECVTGGVIRPAVTEGDGKGWLLSDQWPRAVPGAGGPRWGGSDGGRVSPGRLSQSYTRHSKTCECGMAVGTPPALPLARAPAAHSAGGLCSPVGGPPPRLLQHPPPTPPHPTKSKNCLSFYSHRKTSLNLSSLHNVHINTSKKYSGI